MRNNYAKNTKPLTALEQIKRMPTAILTVKSPADANRMLSAIEPFAKGPKSAVNVGQIVTARGAHTHAIIISGNKPVADTQPITIGEYVYRLKPGHDVVILAKDSKTAVALAHAVFTYAGRYGKQVTTRQGQFITATGTPQRVLWISAKR